jgi:hypothetical protein
MHGIMEQLEFGALYSSAIGMFHSWHQTILTLLSKMSTEVKEPLSLTPTLTSSSPLNEKAK